MGPGTENRIGAKKLFSLIFVAVFLISSVTTASMYIIGGLVNDLGASLPKASNANYFDSHFFLNSLDTYMLATKDKAATIYNWQYVEPGYLYENSDSIRYLSWNEGIFPADNITMDVGFDTPPQLKANIDPVPEPFTFTLLIMGIIGFLMQFSKKIYRKTRILFDVVISTAALAITLPVMAAAAILIKLESPGPVFYKQVRVGLNRRKRRKMEQNNIPGENRNIDNLGSLFTIYKLRTMYCNAEEGTGAVWAKQNDKRITKVGILLRKTRLDEVPQFFNVLKGEMSIIGPRPERPEFVKQLNKSICQYYKRYYVKPGITGLAQVRFRYASSIKDTRKKVRYDLLYLRKGCPLIDLRILLATFTTVFLAKGAR